MRVRWIVVMFTLIALAVAVLPLLQCRYVVGAIEWFRMTRYHDFDFTGEVVDADGQPLNGVTMEVLSSRQVDVTKSESESFTMKLSKSRFAVTRDGVSDVMLYFSLEGFEVESRAFTEGGHHEVRVIMNKKKPRPPKNGQGQQSKK